MFKRAIEGELIAYSKFPVVALLGPRQSGKTTLVKAVFSNHTYISFEDVTERTFAAADPKRFLAIHENEHGIILDEFQYVPEILSYIQLIVDEKKRPGYFILTGSQNFLANQAISQSLAGRVGILTLLPLSIAEMQESAILPVTADELIFNGSYPRLYEEHFLPRQLYPSYIQTYLERDVRMLENIGDLTVFARFAQLCAGRVGQLLHIDNLAADAGVTAVTAKNWLSLLEATYLIFLLQPHHRNFNKRVTKAPKLYFYDTGIACSLLRINSLDTLAVHPLRGALFENMIITDLYKQYYNQALRPPIYFWRDQNGRYEIDCVIEHNALNLVPIEIKSGQTIARDYFKGLQAWREITESPQTQGYVIYGGDATQDRSQGMVLRWQDTGTLVKRLE
jgi:predicted AAA+ superfamily ATPase